MSANCFSQFLAGGSFHSLYLCNDSTVMSCGLNNSGQLGNGTFTKIAAPEKVNNLNGVIAIATGRNHSLFLLSDSSVWACGTGNALGLGTNSSYPTPVKVVALSGIVAIAAGHSHSIFLKNDGTVWACGSNLEGQLGDGTNTNSSLPIQVNNLSDIIAVSAGRAHSIFLKKDGTAWTCGENLMGQMGDGTTTSKNTPVKINSLSRIKKVAAGSSHSVFLDQDGDVFTCGRGNEGQLGYFSGNQTVPFKIHNFGGLRDIAAGSGVTFFIKNDFTVWACGENIYGQLGIGFTANSYVAPPKEVVGLLGIVSVAASAESHSIFLKYDGTVWSCGRNNQGQLGDSTVANSNIPVKAHSSLCKVSTPKAEGKHFIHGFTYNDLSKNCLKELGESSLPSIIVNVNPVGNYALSNDSGMYLIGVDDSTSHKLSPVIPSRLAHMIKNPCPSDYNVFFTSNSPKDTFELDFGLDINPCYQLRVAVTEYRKRRCMMSGIYIHYWNEGIIPVNNVKVHVRLAQYDVPITATTTFTYGIDSTLIFNIGTLNAGQTGRILITDSIACVNGIMGLTLCTKAWITPSNVCYIDSTKGANWDNSSVIVTGKCVTDTARFVISNLGSGNMGMQNEYRVFADNVLKKKGDFQLVSGDSLIIPIYSEGSTVRVEANQHPQHPGRSNPRATVEACGTNSSGTFSIGFVNQTPQNDYDPDVSISCSPIFDSYDPNEKEHFPAGVGTSKIVLPETPISYTIHFQNTGNDTAYDVVIVDTLSDHLDLSTLEFGGASHSYKPELSGIGKPVLKFVFKNIYLVDSATNELFSQGFVNFKITPHRNTPLGTQINNIADIYFDFNLPITTNNSWFTINNYPQDLAAGQNQIDNFGLLHLYPNPASSTVKIDGINTLFDKIYIHDLSGKTVFSDYVGKGNVSLIDIGTLKSGFYIIECIYSDITVGRAKLIKQ